MNIWEWCGSGNKCSFEKRYSFTNIQSPDFVALAASYNIKGVKVEKQEDLKECFRSAFKHIKCLIC
jgi:thiamine pyrophosphate-dependent acetolactate synthase large subunit-like protein